MIIFNLTEEASSEDDGLDDFNYGVDHNHDEEANDYLFNNNLTEAIICENSSQLIEFHSNLNSYCSATWDRISCWPTTPANQLAIIPCFKELNGIPYDSSQNASKLCLANGTWAEKSDYSLCEPITPEELIPLSYSDIWNAKDASTVYYFGYGLSVLALTTALFIFLYFKDLRCARNTIHTNLMVTYELFALTWIITATLQSYQPTNEIASSILCFLYILLPYFTGTQFFWMFIEGLYLYILVVKTFSSVESIKMHFYASIGWGLPAIVVMLWAPFKYFSNNSGENYAESGSNCPWQAEDSIDSIFICPIIFVLMLNIYFLCKIMWVLITKLRAATSPESRQYRKAAKALLVLTPLLGVTYILFLVTPGSGPAKTVFTYFQATLYSTQGFTVSVFFCFLNGEVRNTVRHHLERWKTIRSLEKSNDSISGRKTIAFCSSINSERLFFLKLPVDHKDSTSSNSLLTTSGIVTVLSQPIKTINSQSIACDEKSTSSSSSSSSQPPQPQPQPQPPPLPLPSSTFPPHHQPLSTSPSSTPTLPPPSSLKLPLDDEDNVNHCVTSKLINPNGHSDYNNACNQFTNYPNHNSYYSCSNNNNHHHHHHNHLNHSHHHHHHHYHHHYHQQHQHQHQQHLNHVNNYNHHLHYCFHTQQSTDTINEDTI